MFIRTDKQLPADIEYKPDLTELGFKTNDQGQFVSIAEPTKFFDFHRTNNDRANEVRKEAIHEAAREHMAGKLSELDIKPLYIHATEDDSNLVKLTSKKPDGPHVTVFCSALAQLKKAKSVVIVMGEHNQDAGIWAYRELMTKGGLNSGSAVGIAKAMGYRVTRKDSVQGNDKSLPVTPFATPPGVIILNPGQRLYSPSKNTCESKATWQAKPKANALLPECSVDETYNIIPGHETPEKHLMTFIDSVLNNLCRGNARLFMIGICDGGDTIVKVLDNLYNQDPDNEIGNQIHGISLVQSSFTHESVTSTDFKNKLMTVGQSWIMHDLPKGEVVKAPKRMQPDIKIDAAPITTAPVASSPVAIEKDTKSATSNVRERDLGHGLTPAHSMGDLRKSLPSDSSLIFGIDNIHAPQDSAKHEDFGFDGRKLPRPKAGRRATDMKRGDVNFLKYSPASSGASTPHLPDSPGLIPGRPPGAWDAPKNRKMAFSNIRTVLEDKPSLFTTTSPRAVPTGTGPIPATASATESHGPPVERLSPESQSDDDLLFLGGRKDAPVSELAKAMAKVWDADEKEAERLKIKVEELTPAQEKAALAAAARAAATAAQPVVAPTPSTESATSAEDSAIDPSWLLPKGTVLPNSEIEQYDYDAAEVSCLTRSAGEVSVPELIFPAVMREVLQEFHSIAVTAEKAKGGEEYGLFGKEWKGFE